MENASWWRHHGGPGRFWGVKGLINMKKCEITTNPLTNSLSNFISIFVMFFLKCKEA